MDANTGAVYTATVFDREQEPFVEFHVMASIPGTEERFASRTLVRLSVLDIDDEAPRFIQSTYSFDVAEDILVGTEIGRIVALDRDLEPNNALSYSLEEEDLTPRKSHFVVDESTGAVSVSAALDREQLEQHRLIARVRSHGLGAAAAGGHRWPDDRTEVVVTVLDCNDNAPRVVFPSLANGTVKISSGLAAGEIVARIVAVDDDVGINSQLHYEIQRDDDDEDAWDFGISPESGVVSVVGNLSLSGVGGSPRIYRLTINVRDFGVPSLNSSADLTVEVNDLDGVEEEMKANSNHRKLNRPDGGGDYDESHLVIVLMSVAGCLVVLVAFGLVAALIRKSVEKTIERKIVWSKVTSDPDQLPVTTTTTATATENCTVVEPCTPEMSEASDIILTLECEPVSFAVSKPLKCRHLLYIHLSSVITTSGRCRMGTAWFCFAIIIN